MKVIIERRRPPPTERVQGQVKYRLQGALPFPIDMLRYDAAWPASEQDSLRIEATLRYGCADIESPVTVEVYARRPLTTARWRSFGWVVDVSP